VRFSNGGPQRKSDKAPDVRGIAVKVLGVSGPKALGDGEEQDLLAIQSPSTPFRTADEFVAFVLAASGSQALLPFRFIGAVGFSRGVKILKRLASSAKPVDGLASVRFFSALPVRVGPFAARYAFTPENPPAAPAAERGPGYLAADVAEHLRKRELTWRLEVQFFEDEATTPIEDASVDWSSPYVRVGRLTLPKQDVSSDAGKALAGRVEKMSFDPWHALVEHTPLGGMMRARKRAYFASVKGRG